MPDGRVGRAQALTGFALCSGATLLAAVPALAKLLAELLEQVRRMDDRLTRVLKEQPEQDGGEDRT